MSIQAVGWVLDYSTTKGLDRLVLIAIANHAGEDGECWPSIERIAAEANTKPAQARRVLASLEAAGHIERSINAAPDKRMRGDRRTNLYRILSGGAQKCPPWIDGGAQSAATGARSAPERGGAERAPNHQENHQVEPKPSSAAASGDEATAGMVEELCRLLADAIADHGAAKSQPIISEAWRRDMSLLLRRGPAKATPAPIDPERVARCIAVLFSELAAPEGANGFCWADQVQSPAALRSHWTRIANAARSKRGAGTPAAKRQRMFDEMRAEASGDASVVDIGSRAK